MPKGLVGFQKGHKPFWKHHTKETKEKCRISKIGEKNPMFGKEAWNKGKPHLSNEKNPAWKGNNVSRLSIHTWVRKHFSKTGICEICKLENKTEWSNKDHKYNSRDRSSWQELCRSCHLRYDFTNLKRTKRGKDIKKRFRSKKLK
jgi:hypothetical protein